ncbi:hypothetical protein HBH82_013790 [Parastagonospora nodorum]|nr:hypothetical protein HBH82_013790 [Parastagonospora nodorum]KAH4713535.1 hypothetical protein HBH67_001780 [Parastagonospora nodorum]KAH4792919.1 hypothetical protein HBH62_016970 [Parastagonospora nodorum]KAH4830936.1 hypothetical protein HBH63_035220 [Parastagonospora nodorum]
MARLKELPEPTKARMPQAEVEKLAAEVEAVLREPVNHSIEKAKEFMRAKEEREAKLNERDSRKAIVLHWLRLRATRRVL